MLRCRPKMATAADRVASAHTFAKRGLRLVRPRDLWRKNIGKL